MCVWGVVGQQQQSDAGWAVAVGPLGFFLMNREREMEQRGGHMALGLLQGVCGPAALLGDVQKEGGGLQ